MQKMLADSLAIGLEKDDPPPGFPFHVLRTFAHAMALAGRSGFHLSAGGKAKTLFRPAVGLEFRHFSLPSVLFVSAVTKNRRGRACPKAPARCFGQFNNLTLAGKQYWG
jgi:hypothetical protein